MPSHNPKTEELFHLAGDAPDPLERSGLVGHQATANLTKAAQGKVMVRYKDTVMQIDVYALPGVPIWLHLICPRCRHANKIPEDRKAIEWDPKASPADGGRLSVETFECTWEIDDDSPRDKHINHLCRLRLAINNNVARDA